MHEQAYKSWLQGKLSSRPIADSVSRCRRIEENLKLDLDNEYKRDGGQGLIELLEYTTDDKNHNRPPQCNIYFAPGADLKSGLSSLKNAAKKYFDFCRETL